MTAIVDYRAGNLTSVKYAFAAIGAEATVTSDPHVVAAADRVVFPGVGAARHAMDSLAELGLVDAVRAAARFAEPGDTVLLSPCCASFDLFKDYEDRGRQFKEAVRHL